MPNVGTYRQKWIKTNKVTDAEGIKETFKQQNFKETLPLPEQNKPLQKESTNKQEKNICPI